METVFLTQLEKEYSELIETGKIQLIEEIKRLTSKHFSYNTPLYFLGDISSRIALITFNPKREALCLENKPTDFNAYQDKCHNTGDLFHDSIDTDGIKTSSATDIRMLNYLKPFQIIRFESQSIQKDLQKLTNEKLELGLIPYLSSDFSEKDFLNNYLICKPLIERILSGILAYHRQYIIFIGDCFNEILAEYIEESETFKFLLTSPNRPNQKFVAQFTRVTLNFNNRKVIAGIAESFCDESFDDVLLEKYGQESVSIINRGFILSNPLWKSEYNINNLSV